MIVVVIGFALGDTIIIKQIGLGLAVAVVIDVGLPRAGHGRDEPPAAEPDHGHDRPIPGTEHDRDAAPIAAAPRPPFQAPNAP